MVKPWKQFRERITTLYIKEARTLSEVQRIMKDQHGFVASIRSYRQRFDNWNLTKYNCKKRQQRKEEQRRSSDFVEGRLMLPSPPKSPEDGHGMISTLGIKQEAHDYFHQPVQSWRCDEFIAPQHYPASRLSPIHQHQRQRHFKQRCSPIPERKYHHALAPPPLGAGWYTPEPPQHNFSSSFQSDIKHSTLFA